MKRYVAFLRGINLGKRRVTMADLRQPFEDLGYGDVATFIASGNVIFSAEQGDPDRLETGIAQHLEQCLGYEVDTFLRALPELSGIVKRGTETLAEFPDRRAHVIFLQKRLPATARRALKELEGENDDLRPHGREVYWYRGGGLKDSPFTQAQLEKAVGTRNTMRTLNTVRRIHEKFT